MKEDWVEIEVKELGEIITGNTPSKKNDSNYNSKDFPFYKPTDLAAGIKVDSSNDFLSELGFKTARKAPVGSVLITCIGATIGKTGLIQKEGGFNQQINGIVPFKKLNSKYIYYQVTGMSFQEQIKSTASSTTLPILNKGKFSILKFRLAPLPIQRAIVSKIETLFSDLDKGITDLKKAQEQLKIYRQAVLKKAFEGGFTKQWREKNPYNMDDFLASLKNEKSEALKNKLIAKSDYFPEFEVKDLIYKIPENWIYLPWKTITSNNKYAMKRGLLEVR